MGNFDSTTNNRAQEDIENLVSPLRRPVIELWALEMTRPWNSKCKPLDHGYCEINLQHICKIIARVFLNYENFVYCKEDHRVSKRIDYDKQISFVSYKLS